MFVRGRAWTDEVTVAQVPEISGSWAALREHCDIWRGAVQAARAGVEEQQSTWSGMQAAYDEPETAATVHTALDPLIDPAQLWAGAVERVAEAVESFATTAEALESEADALQQRRPQVLQAARDVEHAGADDDVDAERLQIQDFAWDVASLRHRWEQAQSGAAETIEQQGRVMASVVLPQSAGSGLFSAAGFGVGSVIGSAIGSALSGGLGGAFDPSDVDVDLPPIPTTMSEEERRRYREENPQALEDLMDVDLDELDDETRQQVESAIIRLAVPDVDSSDGETDAETVEEALSDETMADEMTEAFGRSTEISDGLDSLEDWAASNEVDLEESETVAGAMGYLGAFHRATYARRDEVEKYLEDGVRTGGLWPFTEEYEQAADEEQLETIRQGWADGLLTLSREDYGGGWDELPEGMREAAQHPDGAVDFDAFRELMPLLEHADSSRSPGDDLATNLAMAAEYVLHVENARADSAAGADPGVPESALTTALGLAGRNEWASAALLAGRADVDGFDGAELPDSFDSSRFVANVFAEGWEDDGAAVAGLIDWIASEGELSGHSEDAWYGLMDSVTTTDAGATGSMSPFKGLLGGAQGSSLETNPVFAQAFYEVTAANLEEFSVPEGTTGGEVLDNDDHVRVLMLLGTDDAAATKISASIQEYQGGLAEKYATGEPDGVPYETNMAILQSKLEGGLFNAEMHKYGESVEAEENVVETLQAGSELASRVLKHPVFMLGDYVIQGVDGPGVSKTDIDAGEDVGSAHRRELHEARAKGWMARALGDEEVPDLLEVTRPNAHLPEDLRDLMSGFGLDIDGHESAGIHPNNAVHPYNRMVSEHLQDRVEKSEGVSMEELEEFAERFAQQYKDKVDGYIDHDGDYLSSLLGRA